MISCDIHDYIEIACTFGYAITLTMKSGKVIKGKALDTQLDTNRKECILIKNDQKECLVVLDELASMKASTENPHFNLVSFN